MDVTVEKKFAVDVVYNGVEKQIEVNPEERVSALLQRAIAIFGITQNPHLLSLFRMDGSVVPDDETVERAGIKPHEVLLLRPNAVRAGADLLRVSPEVVAKTFQTLKDCGAGKCECGVFWTGLSESSSVDGVEHPIHDRSPFGYAVNDTWLTEFWKRLAASRMSVKAQIHSHPSEAFHSATDDRWPIVSQPGFLSIVVPDFGIGEANFDRAWVGRLRPDGEWERCPSAAEVLVLS